MGHLSGTFATAFDLVFPKHEYSIIWRYSSAETGVKKAPARTINGQVSTRVITCV